MGVFRLVFVLFVGCTMHVSSRDVGFWYSVDNVTEVPIAADIVAKNQASITRMMIYCGYTVMNDGSIRNNNPTMQQNCEHPDHGLIALLRTKAPTVKIEIVLNAGNCSIASYRQLFKAQQGQEKFLVDLAQRLHLDGINLDLEPQPTSLPSDGPLYASFLERLRPQLNAVHTRLTIDVADWSPMLRNYTLLAPTVDRILDMETYNAGSWSQWLGYYEHVVNTHVAPRTHIGVGLGCWINKATNGTWSVTKASAVQRMDRIASDGVEEVDMFRLLPAANWPEPFWWPLLEEFVSAKGHA